MKDVLMEKGIIRIEDIKTYVKSLIHQTSLEKDLSLNVKADQMNRFQSVGNYLRNSQLTPGVLKLLFINRKIKKNATKP